ncbi:MAG TPA: hypothetical protein VKB89_26860 [Xanthobacteraceae bacterium]|nr:hypothetical protein [Xanthobacteraceae bacterium]
MSIASWLPNAPRYVFVLIPCVIVAAYTVFGATGFGSSIITVPTLASPSDSVSRCAGPHAKLRSQIVPAPPERAPETSSEDAHAQGAPARISWARLLKRVFDIDVEHCPNCGGALKIIAAPSSGSGRGLKIRR